MKEQILKDLEQNLLNKLGEAFHDYVSLCKIAGIPSQEYTSAYIQDMMVTTAKAVVVFSTADDSTAAGVFLDVLKAVRAEFKVANEAWKAGGKAAMEEAIREYHNK